MFMVNIQKYLNAQNVLLEGPFSFVNEVKDSMGCVNEKDSEKDRVFFKFMTKY